MKEYTMVVAFGAVSFLVGYFVSQYLHGRVYDEVSGPASLALINTVGFFVGVFPITLHLERTHRSILKAALITLGLAGSWFITVRLWPFVNAALMEHVGIEWFRNRGLFLDPALIVYNGLWSTSFAGLVLLLRQVKRKDLLLMTVLLFLVLIFSMRVPSYFDLSDVEHQVIQRIIFGGLFSLLIRRFFVVSDGSYGRGDL